MLKCTSLGVAIRINASLIKRERETGRGREEGREGGRESYLAHFTEQRLILLKLHQFVSGVGYIQEIKFEFNPTCSLRDKAWAYTISVCNPMLDLMYTFSWLISTNNI